MKPQRSVWQSATQCNVLRTYALLLAIVFLALAAVFAIAWRISPQSEQGTPDLVNLVLIWLTVTSVAPGSLIAAVHLYPSVSRTATRAAEHDMNEARRNQAHGGGRHLRWRPAGLACPRRYTAAAHPRTSRLRLAGLVFSPNDGVAIAAALNPSTPRLARRLAARQLRLRPVLLRDPATPAGMLRPLLTDPHATRQDLAILARHPNTDTRIVRAIAHHPNATIDALEPIAANPLADADTIAGIVGDPLLPFDTREALRIQRAAAGNPACPADVLARLAAHATAHDVLDRVARHPHTPEEAAVLAALRSGETEETRRPSGAPAGLPSWVRHPLVPAVRPAP